MNKRGEGILWVFRVHGPRFNVHRNQYELYELGSQLRRSSISAPANIAEGWNNRHINIYFEGINSAMGELQETLHHLRMVLKKEYCSPEEYEEL